jgi:hypothetical protein
MILMLLNVVIVVIILERENDFSDEYSLIVML